jgi:hypothetical protein
MKGEGRWSEGREWRAAEKTAVVNGGEVQG